MPATSRNRNDCASHGCKHTHNSISMPSTSLTQLRLWLRFQFRVNSRLAQQMPQSQVGVRGPTSSELGSWVRESHRIRHATTITVTTTTTSDKQCPIPLMKWKPRRNFRFLAGVSHRVPGLDSALVIAVGSVNAVIARGAAKAPLRDARANESSRSLTPSSSSSLSSYSSYIWLLYLAVFRFFCCFWPFSHFEFGLQIAAHFHFTSFVSFQLLSCFLYDKFLWHFIIENCADCRNASWTGVMGRYLADFSSIGQIDGWIICVQMRNLAQSCLPN